MGREKSATAEKIIKIASEIFAEQGYNGAKVDAIAKRAKVNKATLYYQIGDKATLYSAVLDRVLGQTINDVCHAVKGAGDPESKIKAFIHTLSVSSQAANFTAPIFLRELASGGKTLPDSALQHMGKLLGALTETIQQGIDEGIFRKVNPLFVHMMILGSILLYQTNEPIRRRNVAKNPEIYNPDHFLKNEESAEQILDLILSAIRA
ncbi:MAG: TetR/AcrR family transcriptional regulator [Chromatiales bacterium]|nr:TetR/AcrR family transcriptional regulator [Chromatiales bacterium]